MKQPAESATTPAALLQLNPHLKIAGGVYQNIDTQIRESQLSSYLQGAVSDTLERTKDHSLYSLEIEKRLYNAALQRAFSPDAVNFLLSFDLVGINNTLDLTQDFGGATHFLATQVGAVDSVKIDVGHARLAAKRGAKLPNARFISADICELIFPENHYDLIVISQLEALGLPKTAQAAWLKKLAAALSVGGRMVISAPNQQRLGKWLSTGAAVIAYQALYQSGAERDYTAAELTALMAAAGFAHSDQYASFSVADAVNNLFAKRYLESNPHALNHFNRLRGIDNADLNEYLLFKNLCREGVAIFNCASRFILIAGATSQATQALCAPDFAHYPGLGRRPQWRTITQSKHASQRVTKTLLHAQWQAAAVATESAAAGELTAAWAGELTAGVSQITAPQVFQSGAILADRWLAALLQPDPVSAFKAVVAEYADWLQAFAKQPDFCARGFDVLPFNIIVDAQGEWHTIDPEWCIDAEFDGHYILFRALFLFAVENKALAKKLAQEAGIPNVGFFVLYFMGLKSMAELAPYIALEEAIQRQIMQGFTDKVIAYALLQTFNTEPPVARLQPACEISWCDATGAAAGNSVVTHWQASAEEQIIRAELPSVESSSAESSSSEVLAAESGKVWLCIAPLASMGMFKFSSIKLLGADDSLLWALNSAVAIVEGAEYFNLSPIATSAAEAKQGISHFVALSENPYFVVALKNLPLQARAIKIEITLALLHNQYYDNTLATLSLAISAQNAALGSQLNKLTSQQTEVEYLSAKLAITDEHRQSLQAGLHAANATIIEVNQTIHAANATIIEVNQTIHAANEAIVERDQTIREAHDLLDIFAIKIVLKIRQILLRLRGHLRGKT